MSTLLTTNLKNPSSGSNNIVLGTDGSTTIPTLSATTITGTSVRGGITSSTSVPSTNGTSIDFISIPSWVKRVTVMFAGVSTSGSSTIQVQLGTGGTPTYTTSGYLGASAAIAAGTAEESNGTGFKVVANHSNTAILHGIISLANITGNTWTQSSILGQSNAARINHAGGSIALAAVLTAVRITTVNGTDTFDAGSINILYEG